MYGNGKGFVPDHIVPNSRLVILAQNPGKDEERGEKLTGYDGKHPVYEPTTPQPLIGATGYALRETYLPLTGERVENVSLCNLLKCRWKNSNNLPTGDTLKQAVEHCTREHLRIPESAELIVAMGGPAFEFTQPELKKLKKTVSKEGEREKGGPITTWRGFIAPETYQGKPVFGVVHLSDLFRDPTQRVPARLDWRRIGRYLRGDWPKPIPGRLIATDDLEKLNEAFDSAETAEFIAVDTEFNPETKFLSLIGIGWEADGAINGIQLEWVGNDAVTPDVRSTFIRRFARLIKKVKVVFQNAKADLVVIDKNLHISWEDKYTAGIEDTMHMHSVLWSEMPHSLEFLASIYGQYPKLKHLATKGPISHEWVRQHLHAKTTKDNTQTQDMAGAPGGSRSSMPVLSEDTDKRATALLPSQSQTVESNFQETPHALAEKVGQDASRIRGASETSERGLCNLQRTGLTSSSELGPRSQDGDGARTSLLEMQRGDRASEGERGGSVSLLKELSDAELDSQAFLLYNWGDICETIEVYKALTREFKADPLTERVYRTQSLPLIPITLRREVHGIRVNQARLEELIAQYSAKVEAFERMAHAYAGYPINLMSTGGDGQLATHLRAYEGINLKSVDEETIASERDKYLPFDREYEEKNGFTPEYVMQRIEEGAHPLLELRAAAVHYSQVLNQDLLPIRGQERVYPSLRHDAQASGRWSTTHPALAKVPNDLLDLYIPDEGKILFGADFDAQEPRIFMAEARSEYLKKAFNEKLDIHTLLVCDMFGWEYPKNQQDPHYSDVDKEWREKHGWGGKEDKRRTVSKNVRYERYYMGTGKNAVDKAVKMGLPKEAMLRASRLVIEQDSNVANFHREIKRLAKTKRIRTWTDRLRVFMGTGEKVEREMCNQKMQGGGVDILNLTVIEVTQRFPFAWLFYTRHDSFWFEIPETMFTPEVAEEIRRIAEQPRPINGMMVPFPGSWKTMDSSGKVKKYTFQKKEGS